MKSKLLGVVIENIFYIQIYYRISFFCQFRRKNRTSPLTMLVKQNSRLGNFYKAHKIRHCLKDRGILVILR